ncbi:hypothetical protein BGZ54_000774 [Gamsiella multidivaricata]|nr:hypothetical protein BGZ54_000774 [Gamsiella multidivaricata]
MKHSRSVSDIKDYETARKMCIDMLQSSFDWVGEPYLLRPPPTPNLPKKRRRVDDRLESDDDGEDKDRVQGKSFFYQPLSDQSVQNEQEKEWQEDSIERGQVNLVDHGQDTLVGHKEEHLIDFGQGRTTGPGQEDQARHRQEDLTNCGQGLTAEHKQDSSTKHGQRDLFDYGQEDIDEVEEEEEEEEETLQIPARHVAICNAVRARQGGDIRIVRRYLCADSATERLQHDDGHRDAPGDILVDPAIEGSTLIEIPSNSQEVDTAAAEKQQDAMNTDAEIVDKLQNEFTDTVGAEEQQDANGDILSPVSVPVDPKCSTSGGVGDQPALNENDISPLVSSPTPEPVRTRFETFEPLSYEWPPANQGATGRFQWPEAHSPDWTTAQVQNQSVCPIFYGSMPVSPAQSPSNPGDTNILEPLDTLEDDTWGNSISLLEYEWQSIASSSEWIRSEDWQTMDEKGQSADQNQS